MENFHDKKSGSLKGAVFGDIIGAPFMVENTSNRYFEIGEPRTVISRGRSRKCFAECTEISHGVGAVSRWLRFERDNPTVESLQTELRDTYNRHPRASWTEATRLSLSSRQSEPSQTSDWAAITRAIPIAMYIRDDLPRALELTEAAVRATCINEEAIEAAKAITQCIHQAQMDLGAAPLRTMLEKQYGFNLSRPENDLRSELRGAVRKPVVMMGQTIEGAYYYDESDLRAEPSAKVVAEAAFRAVVGSDSWEDAVRRAVALGGPSNAVAAIAGGIAETVYGEVTPTLVGKLYNFLPSDIAHHFSELDRAVSPVIAKGASPYQSMSRDAVTIISLGAGNTIYAVPPDRDDILDVIQKSFPNPKIITPEEIETMVGMYGELREGTYAYGIVPEIRTLYLQDGKQLVSPSNYVAPGMPSLQERRKHLEEFTRLRSYCIDVQQRLNKAAGNPDAGQIHYGGAYHLWIGAKRIDFMMGDIRCGSIFLDNRGLLKVDLGDYRDIGHDARFENHREQAWASRGIFTMWDSISPLSHLQDMRNEIAYSLLDEGKGLENHEIDTRYKSVDEQSEVFGVSNLDHLEKLDPGEDLGYSAFSLNMEPGEMPVEGAPAQAVNRIYTLGYGTRTQEGFINTLKMSGIDTVVDVRSYPFSKWVPHFNEDVIYEALEAEGIGYISGGEKLGGRFSDRSLYGADGRVNWESVGDNKAYLDAIASVQDLADQGHMVAIVCSEGDPLTCHRFGLLSRTLSQEGMDVRHILYNGECISHTELEDRLLNKYARQNKVPSVVAASYSDQVRDAYRIMNEEYGYKPAEPFRKHIGGRMKHKF